MSGDGARINSAWLQRRKQQGVGVGAAVLYANGVDSVQSNTIWTNWMLPAANSNNVLPITDYPAGPLMTPGIPIPDTAVTASIAVARNTATYSGNWPSAATNIVLNAEISLDGGNTWKAYGGVSADGGTYAGWHGVPAQQTAIQVTLPTGIGRLIRGNATLSGGSIKTGVAIQFTYPLPTGPVTYTTNFTTAESPLSDGGRWSRNQANQWTNVVTENGAAHGTNGITNTFDDSYALLSGFGNDYELTAVLTVKTSFNSGVSQEFELLLRGSDTANSVTLYECDFGIGGQLEGIVLWNGPFGSFTVLNTTGSQSIGRNFVTGDVVKARIQGSTITVTVNGTVIGVCVDSTLPTGSPGIGFFIRPGGDNAAITIDSLTVTPL